MYGMLLPTLLRTQKFRRAAVMAVAGAAVFAMASLHAAPIHFVVGEFPADQRFHNDSYVVAIDDADSAQLNHARALIDWVAAGANPKASPGETIVVANIQAGSDGINRNALAPEMPLWSWRTIGPISFADFSIEILDGWPTYVEENLAAWIQNTNGAVGFWSYTIVAELKAVPEPSSLATACGALCLLMFSFGRAARSTWGMDPRSTS